MQRARQILYLGSEPIYFKLREAARNDMSGKTSHSPAKPDRKNRASLSTITGSGHVK